MNTVNSTFKTVELGNTKYTFFFYEVPGLMIPYSIEVYFKRENTSKEIQIDVFNSIDDDTISEMDNFLNSVNAYWLKELENKEDLLYWCKRLEAEENVA